MKFFGREHELALINEYYNQKNSKFLTLYGRRRVGKSRLIEAFSTGKTIYSFIGLAPDKNVTAQDQKNEFQRYLSDYGLPASGLSDWSEIFKLLSHLPQNNKKSIIFLDEISWMADKDPTFLPKLKTAWDTLLKPKNNLMLIVCGSVSSWIEQNLLSSTGFVGRITHVINLKELPLNICNQFWEKKPISAYEKFKVLCVTGGIPLYLESFNLNTPFDENIRRLFFTPGGLLLREFESIFSDLFNQRASIYKSIVNTLLGAPQEAKDISKSIGWTQSGVLSNYLADLVTSGFIQRDHSWSFKTGKTSKNSRYRLSDNYVRFYCKYIQDIKEKIDSRGFNIKNNPTLPNLDSILGLQFENLILSNREKVWECLNINSNDIVYDNPYFQRTTKKSIGCQIDYLIQTRFNNLYLIEIKFSKDPVGINATTEMQLKCKHLIKPKNMSLHPVLIHVNGATENVLDSGVFAKIINFADFLK